MWDYLIYIISLKSDIERRAHMNDLMTKLELNYQFFDAIEASDISDDDITNKFSDVDYYQYNLNHRAVMATLLSHVEVIKIANRRNSNILIFEDDIGIKEYFDFNSVNFNDFDVLNIGSDGKKTIDCHSYFVSLNGTKKILNHFDSNKITQAFDWEMVKVNDLILKFVNKPFFTQLKDKFISNLAPNGYENNKMSLG
jgi:GR25 family glycosyltransferase involved in LPS biosynthesis